MYDSHNKDRMFLYTAYRLVFVVDKDCGICDVWTEFLCIISVKISLQAVNIP
jgi:hypothetical protein